MRTPHHERLSAASANAAPERTCILTGRKTAPVSMIRLAIAPDAPDGAALVLPDVLARASGRGAWIGVTQTELATALAKNKLKGALARSFKGARLTIPDDLPERIAAALARALAARLGLEMRAGRLVLGSDRIAEQARAGRLVWLAHAADASLDGRRKLDQALRVGSAEEGSGRTGITLPLDRAALSVALGRDNVVHLGINDPAAAARVAALAGRLLHFLGAEAAVGQQTTGEGAAPPAPLALTDI